MPAAGRFAARHAGGGSFASFPANSAGAAEDELAASWPMHRAVFEGKMDLWEHHEIVMAENILARRAGGSPVTDPASGAVLRFADRDGEIQIARTKVAIADLSQQGRVEVAGDDRVKFLNNLSTNDITKISMGGGAEAFFLDARGRILDYGTLFALPDALWIDTAPGRAQPLIKHLDRYLIREKVLLTDRTPQTAELHLAGPEARALIRQVTPEDGPELQELQHRAVTIAGHPCQVRCHARSKYVGFDILLPLEALDAVTAELFHRGAEVGIRPIGSEAMDFLRIEAGIPVYGRDISDANFPQEVGRDVQAISFNKGCYIGQETVARIDSYGHVNRLLRGLVFTTEVPVAVPTPVKLGDKEVGTLTSVARAPVGDQLGLAILRKGSDNPGNKVLIDSSAGPIEGTVVALPFD